MERAFNCLQPDAGTRCPTGMRFYEAAVHCTAASESRLEPAEA